MAKDYANAGEKASAAGLDIVDPAVDTYYNGGDEINITRDMVADTRDMIADRSMVGTTLPAKGEPGQIFFRIGPY